MDQVYTPIVIQDNPLPDQMPVTESAATGADSSTSHVSQPSAIPNALIPRKMVAQETIGETLNTKAKKITADYSFTQQGSLDIGEYKPGVSGDIRISPNGITARNLVGNTTFDIDGDTGDAVFAGQLRSGTLIAGELTLGNGSIVLDDLGLRSTTSFLNSITTHGTPQTFTTNSYVDNVGSSQTFILERTTNILLSLKAELYIVESAGNTGSAALYIDIDGAIANNGILFIGSGNNATHTYSLQYLVTLPAGTHTIKLKSRFESAPTGSPVFNVSEFYLTRLHLGS